MDTKLSLDKVATITADYNKLLEDVGAIEPILSIFPKIESLTKLSDSAFKTQLKPIGAMGVEHAVCYAADYSFDKANGTLSFKAKEGVGNASLSGAFIFKSKGSQVEVEVKINGQLREIKVPFALKLATPGFIKTMFEGLVDRLIQKIEEKY